MPITIEAMAKEDFEAWVAQAQQEFAKAPSSIDVAAR
jgi:heme/copper-type cytochrome/quinol oxidase subunit 2